MNMDADTMRMLEEMQASREQELHPDLQPYVEHDENLFGPMLRHPLVYQIPLIDNGMANHCYERKQPALMKAYEERNWHQYVFLHERPYRFKALLKALATSDSAYGVVRDVWIDSENIWQNKGMWLPVLKDAGPKRLMLTEERKALADMPDLVTVYRGCRRHNKNGISWTTDKARAEWFARRFSKPQSPGLVQTGKVSKSFILAFLTGRSEDEVLVPFNKVAVLGEEKVS